MAKVTLTIEDDEEGGTPFLHITLRSDPPFSDEGGTAAQMYGIRALEAIVPEDEIRRRPTRLM